MKTRIELDIPMTAAERIAQENESRLTVAAARIADIAEPDDPHARHELMQAIIDLATKPRASVTQVELRGFIYPRQPIASGDLAAAILEKFDVTRKLP